LKRYLAEFDFRYNQRQKFEVNDELRAERLSTGLLNSYCTGTRL